MPANELQPVVTNVLVPGRGHRRLPDGKLGLTKSSEARVTTTVDYYLAHEEDFKGLEGRILFEGGYAKLAAGMGELPLPEREGQLMLELAVNSGLPERLAVAGVHSISTGTNIWEARKLFLGASDLEIATQLSQWPRFAYFGSKFLPGTRLHLLTAPGETDSAIIAEEERLLKFTKILYAPAIGKITLTAADYAGSLLGRLSSQKPGEAYGSYVSPD